MKSLRINCQLFYTTPIHAVRKPLKRFLPVTQSARPDWLCTKMARPPMAEGGFGRNTAAPSANPKRARVPAATKTGTTARKTGAARNTGPFQTITGFPLTGNACVLSVSMPCVQSVSVITSRFKASGQERLWVRNGSSAANLNTLAHISALVVALAAVLHGSHSYRSAKQLRRSA